MSDIFRRLKQIDENVEIIQSVSTISNQQLNLSTNKSGSLNMIFTCPSSNHALILSQSTMAFIFTFQTELPLDNNRQNIRLQPNFLGNMIISFTLSVNNMESNNISNITVPNSNISALLNFNNMINLQQSEFNLLSSVSDCNFIAIPGDNPPPPLRGFFNASIIKNPGKTLVYKVGSQEVIVLMNIANICSLANSLNLIPGMVSFNITFSFEPDQIYQPLNIVDYPLNPATLIPQGTKITLRSVDLYASLAKFSSSIPVGISFKGLAVISASLPNVANIEIPAGLFSPGAPFFSNNIQLAPNRIQYMLFIPYIANLGEPLTTPSYEYVSMYSPIEILGNVGITEEVLYKIARNGSGLDDSINISLPKLIFGGSQVLNSNNLLKYEPGLYQSIDNYLFSFIHGQSVSNDGSSSRSTFPFNLYNQNKIIIFDCSKVDFSSYQNQVGFSCFIQPTFINVQPGRLSIRFLYYIFSEKIYT